MPTSIDCRPNGSIKELQYGSQQGAGRKYTTTQNARQLPANLKVVLGTSTLANLTHSYDANGNVTFIDDAVNGSSFDRSMGYDDLDRLESASGFWGAGSYSFDALGNIRTKTESGIDLDYTYSAGTNRLASIDDTVGSADYSFSYDSYGNVTNNGSQGFAYNLAGQMTSSTNPSVSYQYDGHNRRVQKTEGGQTGYTVYGASGRLMHKRKGGVSTHYLYAGSLLIAEKQGSNLHYIHTDLLGSPIKGDNGTSYSEHYRPWGEKKDHPTQLADDVGYTGHQADVATGLTYMQARYYDPVVGRFMAVDPLTFNPKIPQTFNAYSYVENNPINAIDPDGKETWSLNADIDLVAGVGGGVSIGVYLNTGSEPGERFDIGLTGSARIAAGADASAGVTIGKFLADASQLNGLSKFTEFSVGAAEVQLSQVEDIDGHSAIGSPGALDAGVAISPLAAGVQIGHELTGKLGFQDAVSAAMTVSALATKAAHAVGDSAKNVAKFVHELGEE